MSWDINPRAAACPLNGSVLRLRTGEVLDSDHVELATELVVRDLTAPPTVVAVART